MLHRRDSKEGERKKLAELMKEAAKQRASSTGGSGPQLWVLDVQVRARCCCVLLHACAPSK